MTRETDFLKLWLDGEGAGGAGDGAGAGNGGAGDGAGAGSGEAPFEFADFDVRSILPDDLKNHKSLEKFTGKGADFIESIVRSNIAAQQMIGSDPNSLLKLPPVDKLTTEDRVNTLKRLGLPADEKAWTLKPMEKPVKGFEPDSPLAKWLSSTARELNLFPDQTQAIYERFVDHASKGMQEEANRIAAQDDTNIQSLQKELGKAFDQTVRQAQYATKALDKLVGSGDGAFGKALDAAGLGTNPLLVKALAKVGEILNENGSAGDKQDFGHERTPGQINEEAQNLIKEAALMAAENPAKARELSAKAQKILAGN